MRNLLMHSHRWKLGSAYFIRYLTSTHRGLSKNFDRAMFDYFYQRRLQRFNGDREQMSTHLRTHLESLLKTPSALSYLTQMTSESPPHPMSITELCDLLFFAYGHDVQLNFVTQHFLECLTPIDKHLSPELLIELLHLLVLHQQKHYDSQTKAPNQILTKLLHQLEFRLTNDQIQTLSISDLSLICSAMYRLHVPLTNKQLLERIAQCLIDDERTKSLSAVDKQNLVKLLTLSNYGRIDIADALTHRFNQSFEQHCRSDIRSLSYEIVRMTMRIGIYCSTFRFYSSRFFDNCLRLIDLEASSSKPVYRAKDITQIMNTLISMGHRRIDPSAYHDLIHAYDQLHQFDREPERLVDVLAPLAMIDCFPEDLLAKLFTQKNLNRWTESRLKEKLFFIAQSHKLLRCPQRPLLDQNYLDSLPHHLFGSWDIEKRKRPYFSIVMQRLLASVPSRLYVQSAFLLKHFKNPDILLRLSADQQPQFVSNSMKKSMGYFDETDDQCTMYALEVLTHDEVCANEPLRPMGWFFSKASQLSTLHYTPVIIYPNDSLHEITAPTDVFQWVVDRAQKTDLLLKDHLALKTPPSIDEKA